MFKKGDNVICRETKRLGVILSDKKGDDFYDIRFLDGSTLGRKEGDLEKMRAMTKEEQEAYNQSLDKLFQPIGINLFDL